MTESEYFEDINFRNGFNSLMFVLGIVFISLWGCSLLIVLTIPGSMVGMEFITLLIGSIMIPALIISILVYRKLGFVWTPHGFKKRQSEE